MNPGNSNETANEMLLKAWQSNLFYEKYRGIASQSDFSSETTEGGKYTTSYRLLNQQERNVLISKLENIRLKCKKRTSLPNGMKKFLIFRIRLIEKIVLRAWNYFARNSRKRDLEICECIELIVNKLNLGR